MITAAPSDVLARHNVTVMGPTGGRTLLLAHGFGCDQAIWRRVAGELAREHRVVLFDHAGSAADAAVFRPERYGSLGDYASDVLAICRALDLHDVTLIAHSVSSMIAVLAAQREPERFASLVLVGPSPRYIDDAGYRGGFTRDDIDGLLETMDTDYLGWSSAMAPMIMGNPDQPDLGEELTASFCRTDPTAARHFARLTFLSDNRADLAGVRVPTLILQCTDDLIAPTAVGAFVHEQIPGSELVLLEVSGHCPHLSAPDETLAAIRAHLAR